jgi:hypothetical protein
MLKKSCGALLMLVGVVLVLSGMAAIIVGQLLIAYPQWLLMFGELSVSELPDPLCAAALTFFAIPVGWITAMIGYYLLTGDNPF